MLTERERARRYLDLMGRDAYDRQMAAAKRYACCGELLTDGHARGCRRSPLTRGIRVTRGGQR